MQNINRGRCAVCGEEEIQFFPMDVNGWSPSIIEGLEKDQMLDLGFGDYSKQVNNLMLSHVSMCRHCAYCSADIFAPTKVDRTLVENISYRAELYRNLLSLSMMHFAAYRLAVHTKDINAAVFYLIVWSWANRDSRYQIPNKKEMAFLLEDMCMLPKGVLLSLLNITRKNEDAQSSERIMSELRSRDLTYCESAIVSAQEDMLKRHVLGDFYISQALEFAEEKKNTESIVE